MTHLRFKQCKSATILRAALNKYGIVWLGKIMTHVHHVQQKSSSKQIIHKKDGCWNFVNLNTQII